MEVYLHIITLVNIIMIYIPREEVASVLKVYPPLKFHMEEYQFEGELLSTSDAK